MHSFGDATPQVLLPWPRAYGCKRETERERESEREREREQEKGVKARGFQSEAVLTVSYARPLEGSKQVEHLNRGRSSARYW